MPIKVLIIIPCFNEEKSIALLLEELLKINFSNKYRVEIVVVNDGSQDKTVEVVSQFNVTILDLPVNIGIGGAVQTGLKYAFENDFEIAIQVDGDGQHPPMEILKMLKAQEENPSNLIIGSRFISKEGFQSSLLRRLGIFYLHWLNKILTQKNFYDITSGFRLFDKKAISLAARFYPDEYPEPESLVIFAKAGFSISETPVLMKPRQGGQSSIRYFSQVY
jgi:hypothetical protein